MNDSITSSPKKDEVSDYLTGRMPVLDGIRGCAILAVLLIHTSAAKLDTGFLFNWVYGWGWIGVDLFFVLSGFLITGILWESRNRVEYFRNFYARRILRIFPLYYALLIFVFFLLPHFPVPGRDQVVFHGTILDQLWYWLYVSNIGEALGYPVGNALLGITWSLCIEEQFYVIWPWLVRKFSRLRLLSIAGALLLFGVALRAFLTGAGWNGLDIYVFTLTHFDGLAVGAAIALSLRDDRMRAVIRDAAPWVLLGGTTLFVAVAVHEGSWYRAQPLMQNLGFPALALAFGGLITMALYSDMRGGRLARVLRFPFLRFAGTLCYGLYLLHPLVANPLRVVFVQVLKPLLPGHQVALQIGLTLTVLPISFALAILSWRFFELPILGLKRRFVFAEGRVVTNARSH
jgi:peptidoglycan/LPS O-acetylase OafA/YrhL